MLLAPVLGAPPREVAERLGEALRERLGERVERVEVAGPGFLNLFLSDAWYTAAVAHVLAAGGLGRRHGRPSASGSSSSSSPPTRPGRCTSASARNAAYGDALARLLAFAGHDVVARVLLQRRRRAADPARRVDPGAGARRGGARGRLPGRVRRRAGGRRSRTPPSATPRSWPRGRPAHDRADQGDARALPRRVRHLVLRAHACTRAARSSTRSSGSRRPGTPTASEGALWLRTTDFGDDKDRVIERSSGDPRTSPPTSPTSRTSSSAASSA